MTLSRQHSLDGILRAIPKGRALLVNGRGRPVEIVPYIAPPEGRELPAPEALPRAHMSLQEPQYSKYDDPGPIGRWIRRERLARCWSQVGLGRELGVSGPTVSNWERGFTVPNQRRVAEIALAFGDDAPCLEDLGGGET